MRQSPPEIGNNTFNEMELHFRYTEADFLEFLQDYFWRNRRQLYLLLAFSALIALVFTHAGNPFSLQFLLSVSIPIVMIMVLWFWILRYSGRKTFRMTPQMQEDRICRIGGAQIQMNGTTFSSSFEWSAVQQVVETKNLILLYSSASSALILPKRAFASDQLPGFRALVDQMPHLKVKWK